jgi:hypothetical protein
LPWKGEEPERGGSALREEEDALEPPGLRLRKYEVNRD